MTKLKITISFIAFIIASLLLATNSYAARVIGFNQMQFGSDLSLNGSTLTLYTANTSRIFVANNGLVGIGTITPGQKLHVIGSINASDKIYSNVSYSLKNHPSYNPLDDDLVLYLPFSEGNESNDATVYDRSKFGSNGVCNGVSSSYGCNWTTGPNGNALKFDGVNDNVTGSDANLPFGSSPRTATAWVKQKGASIGNNYIFSYGSDAASQQLFAYGIQAAGTVVFSQQGSSFSSTGTVNDDKWHHIAVTHDGANQKIYIDGVQDGSGSLTVNTVLNQYMVGTIQGAGGYINASIDEVRVYKRALTSDEIRAQYLAGLNATAKPYVSPSGNVGIGTASPTAKLEVAGSDNSQYLLNISRSKSGGTLMLVYDDAANNNGDTDMIRFWQRGDLDVRFQMPWGGSKFIIRDNTSGVPYITLTNLGNVGINTTSPTQTLQVDGNAFVHGGPLTVDGDSRVTGGGGIASALTLESSSNTGGTQPMIFRTAGTERMQISSSGTVTINGTLQKGTSAYNNPDIAEKIPSTQLLEEGDLVIVDGENNNHVKKSTQQYQNVMGVVSPNAAMVIGNWRGGFDGYNIALLGRVAVKISLENGAIKRGDALTSSSKEGFAMKATQSGRIIGYALEDYNENKKAIELEGTKTEQFKARFSRDLGKKKLREKAKDILKESKIENKKSANLISGNAVNEAGLETDLSNILEPASNTTTTAETSTEQTTSVIVENISNAEIVNASGGNENTSQINETLQQQTKEQINNVENKNINSIDEIQSLDDLKNIYRKSRGKNLEDNDADFKKAMEAVKEKERLDEDAKAVEANAVPKILAILSPGLNQAEAQAPQQITQLNYMSKVNGSIILKLG